MSRRRREGLSAAKHIFALRLSVYSCVRHFTEVLLSSLSINDDIVALLFFFFFKFL